MSDTFTRGWREHLELFATLDALQPQVRRAAACMTATLRAGGKLMFCGNGGSAADSQHLATELTGRYLEDRAPLAAIALTTDSSALTCIGNDYSFAEVFDRQVRGLARAGDCLIGISTSGNSENVLRAVKSARALGVHCIGLLGRDGGKLAPLCDPVIVVAGRSTARIQEAHIFIGHTLCALIEEGMGLAEKRQVIL
jgi:D-sedoheptulose 7-phosphate isomerase